MSEPLPIEPLRGFDRSLPMSLMRAREVVMKEFVPSLRDNDLTPQQWRVIRSLEHIDGQTLSELSQRCFLMMPSVSRIVQAMEARGLVSRASVAADQRQSRLSLTKAGQKVFSEVAPKSSERYEYITQKFGYGKLELLYELLDELVEKLDEPDPARPSD